MLPDVGLVLVQLPLEHVDCVGSLRTHPWHMLESVDGQVIAAHLVEHNHIEWSSCGALIVKTTDMEPRFVGTAVHHAVDEPAIAVEGEDYVDVAREKFVEGNVVHAVRVIVGTHQHAEIDDVDDANLYTRHMLLQEPGCGASFDGGNVSRTGQNDVRLRSAVVGREFPNRRALRAMRERFFKRQPLQFRLFPTSDYIHVIPAAHAVVEHVEQTVRIGWVVNTNYFAAPLHHVVDKARGLMAETVVIVTPGVAGEQDIERGERPAPGKIQALLQPFRVLRDHRVDDLRERFVGRPHAVPAGQKIAFEPAFAKMFAEHFHDAAIGSEMVVDGDGRFHGAAIGDFEGRVRADWNWFRPGQKRRKLVGLSLMMSRKYSPSLRGASATT